MIASAGVGGGISPTGSQTVDEGGTLSFTITASAGYQLDNVGGTCPVGSLSGDTYTTGGIEADCTVVANFVEIPVVNYTVTSSAGSGGSISPSGSQIISEGDTVQFSVVATLLRKH